MMEYGYVYAFIKYSLILITIYIDSELVLLRLFNIFFNNKKFQN